METNQFNRAKTWQIMGFALNNTATNCCLLIMNYVAYYAGGLLGLGVTLVSSIVMYMRIFDGITDPIIGLVVDKTRGKFGKYRPFLVLGQVVMWISILSMYFLTYKVPENFKFLVFLVCYFGYIIGYTFQTVITKAAQVSLTNDPKQRPMFSLYDGIYNTILFAIIPVWVASILTPKHQIMDEAGKVVTSAMNNVAFFQELAVVLLSVAGVFTLIAIISIASKDKKEYWGVPNEKIVTIKDYWQVLKGNRAIQMLVVAASTDKLASSVAGNATIAIMLYAIIIGDYTMMGTMASITSITTVIFLIFGTRLCIKAGQKRGVVVGSIGGIISQLVIVALLLIGNPQNLNIKTMSFAAILFVLMNVLYRGFVIISGSIVIPMTADCTDYETYRSGKFVPGLMGTLFSFVDKIISSFAATIVGFSVAFIGFKDQFPTEITPYSDSILYITVFLFAIVPIIGLVCNLIAMKFYPLTKEKMEEIQEKIAEVKKEALAKQ